MTHTNNTENNILTDKKNYMIEGICWVCLILVLPK